MEQHPVAMYLSWCALGLVLVGVLLVLSGCVEYGQQLNKLYGLDCSQAALQQNQGRCAAVAKKGG